MAITDNIIKMVKFPPELIPDSFFGNVPLNGEVAPPVLDVKRFSPYVIALENLQLLANANVELRARYDAVRVNENTAAMLNALPGAWRLLAKDLLYLNFFGVAAVGNYTMHYGLWTIKPTVAHKLLYNIKLTEDEKVIDNKLGIANSVEKGVLPLPIIEQIQREYRVIGEETHSRSVTIAVANTTYTIDDLYPRGTDEFIVLTRIAAAPGAAAQIVRFIVDRDDDVGIVNLPTFPLSLVAGGEIACFIPAIREIKLTTTATVAPGAHIFRFTFQRVKLSNLLRVRFGLLSRDDAPADLWDKVMGGVL